MEHKIANNLRQQKRMERKSRMYSQFQFHRGKHITSGGIDRLEVPVSWPTRVEYDKTTENELEDPKTVDPNDNSKWRTVNCPDEIEFLLRLRNQRHFGQAETDGTQFTTERMKEGFDWAGSTDKAKMTLMGYMLMLICRLHNNYSPRTWLE